MRRLVYFCGLLLCAAAFCTLLSGCGNAGTGRYEVTGTVTFRGQLLDEGVIDFLPEGGQGTKSGATILNGAYRIPRDKGLAPGKYRIVIVAGPGGSSAGAADPEARSTGFVPGVKERIPARYNEKSEIIREVTADGPNRFDFSI